MQSRARIKTGAGPRRIRRIAVRALAVLAVATTGSCTAHDQAERRTHSVRPVILNTGTTDGVAWQFEATYTDGQLCLALVPLGGQTMANPGWGGTCGFGPDPRYPYDENADYWASGSPLSPEMAGFSYGPLPTSATHLRVASKLVIPTYPFPQGVGLPAGRYWLRFIPANHPDPADGTVFDQPQPLDDDGNPVAMTSF